MSVQTTGGGDRTPAPTEEGSWRLFRGQGEPHATSFPEAPPWRRFGQSDDDPDRAASVPPHYVLGETEIDVINAALYLRRPLLVTGNPGAGKTSLARAIAHELALGPVLSWPINSRSTLRDALYRYDAIGRLHESSLRRDRGESAPNVGDFIRLGPVGTALIALGRPRVLLIDELDKGDVDLPNDLLTIFEEGVFEIPELARLPEEQNPVYVMTADRGPGVPIASGLVRCTQFPVVVLTSNGERDFPPAFLRRCVPLRLADPDPSRLKTIIINHLGPTALGEAEDLVAEFLNRRGLGSLATDQLLNAVFLRHGGASLHPEGLLKAVLGYLDAGD